jgi:hypothetical protein
MNMAEIGFGTIVIAIVVFILAILIVQYIWNAVMPDIFPGSKQIGFWQTVGLLILVNILFGGHCNSAAFAHY